MSKVIVVKEVVTETAHRLHNHDGVCKNIHGHSYRWQVGVSGEVNKATGMIIDFKILKNILQRHIIDPFDHKLILSVYDRGFCYEECNVTIFDMLPTVENFVAHVATVISNSVSLKSFNGVLEFVRCWETEKSYAEWRA